MNSETESRFRLSSVPLFPVSTMAIPSSVRLLALLRKSVGENVGDGIARSVVGVEDDARNDRSQRREAATVDRDAAQNLALNGERALGAFRLHQGRLGGHRNRVGSRSDFQDQGAEGQLVVGHQQQVRPLQFLKAFGFHRELIGGGRQLRKNEASLAVGGGALRKSLRVVFDGDGSRRNGRLIGNRRDPPKSNRWSSVLRQISPRPAEKLPLS